MKERYGAFAGAEAGQMNAKRLQGTNEYLEIANPLGLRDSELDFCGNFRSPFHFRLIILTTSKYIP